MLRQMGMGMDWGWGCQVKLSRCATALILWGLWNVPISSAGPDQNLNAPSPPPSFEGELLRIEGDRYIVKDVLGVERQVHVGRNTEIFGQAKAGDRIQLWIQADQHAQTIVVVQSGTH